MAAEKILIPAAVGSRLWNIAKKAFAEMPNVFARMNVNQGHIGAEMNLLWKDAQYWIPLVIPVIYGFFTLIAQSVLRYVRQNEMHVPGLSR